MLKNLPLRIKLIAIAVPPLLVLAALAFLGISLSRAEPATLATGDGVRTIGFIALMGLVAGASAVFVVTRTITDPLEDVRRSADELATERLPALVEALRTSDGQRLEYQPLAVTSDDELGKVIEALNMVQSAVMDVAVEQQELVRKGLSELVINLARRNQTLLDRQIETIDDLEARAQDPDELEALFALDHLATRMRRNAESLLVLADAEPPRRRGEPVSSEDILRVAMSEIEDYQRVELVAVAPAQVQSQAAIDLAHLCSELLENATQFSPPDRNVIVDGIGQPDGSYLISITDQGIGMSPGQLDAANSLLESPPDLGLGLSRSLGFIVVGRLARRLGVKIKLAAHPRGGTTAMVLVPQELLMGVVAPPSSPPPAALQVPGSADPLAPDMTTDAGAMPPAHAVPMSDPSDFFGGQASLDAPVGGAHRAPFGFDAVDAADPSPVGAFDFHADPVIPEPRRTLPIDDDFASDLPPRGEPASYDPMGFDAAGYDSAGSDSAGFGPSGFESDRFEAAGFEPMGSAPVDHGPVGASDAPRRDHPASESSADRGSVVPGHPEIQSEALARLLGLLPPAGQGGSAQTSDGSFGGATSDRWEGPIFEPEPLPSARAPEKLSEALPEGDDFESGLHSLLDPDMDRRTQSGLAKRDRSQSQAPVSEGRNVAASGRSPEEIRQMLGRYRDGRNRQIDPNSPSHPDSAPDSSIGDYQ